MSNLTRKGYARIYVAKPENVTAVEQIIKELDEFEHSYMPKGLVTCFSAYPGLVYTHKFDGLDMDKLTATCWKRGIFIFVLDNGFQEYVDESRLAKVTP